MKKLWKYFCFLSLIFMMVGFSVWAIPAFPENTGNIFDYNAANKHNVTLVVKEYEQINTSDFVVKPGPSANDREDYEISETEHINDSGNVLTHGQKQRVGNVTKEPMIVSGVKEVVSENLITYTTTYEREVVRKVGSNHLSLGYREWWHKVKKQRRYTSFEFHSSNYSLKTYENFYSVSDNTNLPFLNLNITDRLSYGFFEDLECNKPFNFDKKITSDLTLYALSFPKAESLADKINNGETTINVYNSFNGGLNGNYDVIKDPLYNLSTRTLYLNKCTISQNQTLNLTYGSNKIYTGSVQGSVPTSEFVLHRNGDDPYISPDFQNIDNKISFSTDNKQLEIKLNGDLTIKGNLNIGGKVGAPSETAIGKQSFIIGNYAQLDLCGHNIIVDGGKITNFGVIKDSVGGGEISVINGGKITTTITIGDMNGRDNTVLSYTKRQSPFTEYKICYLQVPCFFEYGTTFQGFMKIDIMNFGISNVYLDIYGNSQSNSLFMWDNGKSSSTASYFPTFQYVDKLYPVEDATVQINNKYFYDMYYLRNRFEINGDFIINKSILLPITASLNGSTIDVNVDLCRIDVPISPYFDIRLKGNSVLTVYPKLIFYPGSSFYSEKNTTIKFMCQNAITKYDDIGNSLFKLPGESRYISGGMQTYEVNNREHAIISPEGKSNFSGYYSITEVWKNIKPNNVQIDGSVEFDLNNPDFYYISGFIDLSSKALNSVKNAAQSGKLKSYDIKGDLHKGFCFHRDYNSIPDMYLVSSGYSCLPLVSLGKAFLLDGNNQIEGTYKNGIITDSKNKSYFLLTDTDMYEDGSSKNNQASRIDRNLIITNCTATSANSLIYKNNDTYYAYYCGIFVPIIQVDFNPNILCTSVSVNLRKFFSNKDANLTDKDGNAMSGAQNSRKYDNAQITFSADKRKFSNFN